MLDNTGRWKLLCEQAAKEHNPLKLIELIREINDLLGKEHQLEQPDEKANGKAAGSE